MDPITSENILVGTAMIVLASICLWANGLVLSTIASSAYFYVHFSYKLMLLMGVFDVAQLVVHFITGVFTVFQFEGNFLSYTILGVVISPSYECYIFVTVLLSFNRFILLCCHSAEDMFFSPLKNRMWILLTFLIYVAFGSLHATDKVFSFYSIHEYKWAYDYSFVWSKIRQNVIMYYQILGIFVAWVFYISITVSLLKYRKEMDSVARFKANRKILIQAFVITLYCTFQNIVWHKLNVFIPGGGRMTNFALNMMWIGNAGLSPFLCLALNKMLRKRIFKRLFCQTDSVTTFNAQQSHTTFQK